MTEIRKDIVGWLKGWFYDKSEIDSKLEGVDMVVTYTNGTTETFKVLEK